MGKQKNDMLHGSIWRGLPRFALPIAVTAILGQLFNASDIAVVGNFAAQNRTAAVAAVGANSPIVSLIVNLFIGISLGSNVVIANAIGRRDESAIEETVHTSIVIAVLGGVLVALLGELCASWLLRSFHVPEDVFDPALHYLRIYLLGMPVILLYNFEAAIFRSAGETKLPLLALSLSGVLNVFLNLFFVLALGMNVEGVAIATVISNAVSSAILFAGLLRTEGVLRVHIGKLRLDRGSFRWVMKIGLPAGAQSAVFSISNLVIQAAINTLGTNVMAGSSAAFNLEVIAYYVFNAFTQACTTFVGQNYGAGQLDRCKKTLRCAYVEDALVTGAAIALVLAAGRTLLALFNRDPEVIACGYTRLVVIFFAYAFSMTYEMIAGYLHGFGISMVPAVLTMLGVCGVRIVWVYTAFAANRTFDTLLLAYPLSLAVTAALLLGALLFYRPAAELAKENAAVR